MQDDGADEAACSMTGLVLTGVQYKVLCVLRVSGVASVACKSVVVVTTERWRQLTIECAPDYYGIKREWSRCLTSLPCVGGGFLKMAVAVRMRPTAVAAGGAVFSGRGPLIVFPPPKTPGALILTRGTCSLMCCGFHFPASDANRSARQRSSCDDCCRLRVRLLYRSLAECCTVLYCTVFHL